MSSAAVVIGASRVKYFTLAEICTTTFLRWNRKRCELGAMHSSDTLIESQSYLLWARALLQIAEVILTLGKALLQIAAAVILTLSKPLLQTSFYIHLTLGKSFNTNWRHHSYFGQTLLDIKTAVIRTLSIALLQVVTDVILTLSKALE